MVMPGDTVSMTVSLITPVALEEQMRFAIREGGRTVGAGVVVKILELSSKAWATMPPSCQAEPGRGAPRGGT
jgi:hypothetical protein